jgi:Tfp pilus assembly protein PilF
MRLKRVVSATSNLFTATLLSALIGCAASPKPSAQVEADLALSEQAAPAREKPQAAPLVREGEALLTQGDAAGAKTKFEAALEADASDSRALLGLGLAYEALSDPKAAEDAYRRAAAANPKLAEAHNNLGLLLRDAGRDAEALEALRAAVEADPRLASAQANLALALEDAGQVDEAKDAYARAATLAPRDAMLRANRGLFLLSTGDADGALPELQAGLELGRNDRAVLVAVGNGLRRAGKPDEAVRALRTAIDVGDGKPTPALLSELGLAQHAAGDADGAIQSFEQALTLDPKYAAGHYVLAGVLAGRGQMKQAVQHYKRCIALEPRGPLAERAKQKLEMAQKSAPR